VDIHLFLNIVIYVATTPKPKSEKNMNTNASVIAMLTAELVSWEKCLARKQALIKGFKFNTKKDERYALIELADYTKVVEGKRNRLNEYLAKD